MLSSRIKALLFPPEASRGLRLAYAALYAALIMLAFWMIVVWRYASKSADTFSYIEAAQFLMEGRPHIARPPVYPALLALVIKTFGLSHVLLGTQVVQWVLFIVSVTPFRLGAQRVLPSVSGWWVFAATAFYALNPGLIYYNDILRSETLSFVLTSFFLAALLRGIRERRTPSMIKAALWLAAMIMTKPVFICFIPIYIAVIVTLRFQLPAGSRRICTSATLAIIGVIAMCDAYVIMMNHNFGIRAMTDVAFNNNYFILRNADLVRPELAPTPEMADAIRKVKSDTVDLEHTWREVHTLWGLVSPRELKRYVDATLVAHPEAIRSTLVFRFTDYIFTYDFVPWWFFMQRFDIKNHLIFSIGHTVILLLLLGISLLVYCIRRRRVPLTLAVIWALPTTLLLCVVVGAPEEYSRLFTPCVGVFTLLLVCLTQKAATILHAKLSH